MLSPAKVSPSKGKIKPETHWNMEWWDFYPLVEGPKRPVVWASSSIIFTAHSVQPVVTARLFPSSQTFQLPASNAILGSPQSYGPPTLISASPESDWLFAYFPGRGAPGRGCIWKRGDRLDMWQVQDVQDKDARDISVFPMSVGVVEVEWLGTERQWVTDENGLATRLPPCGPRIPVAKPGLLLVTADHQLHLWYLRAFTTVFRSLKMSLLQPGLVAENITPTVHDDSNGPGGVRVCIGASIALAYNEPSVIIATRSTLHPSPTSKSSSFDPMDLSMSMDVNHPADSGAFVSNEWETWSQEPTIDLCEVQVGFDGTCISMKSHNLLPIHHERDTELSNLKFVCTPPALAEVDNAKATESRAEKGSIALVAGFLNFNDYSSIPQSQLSVYSISRVKEPPNATHVNWTSAHQSSRTFQSGVLAFITPSAPSASGSRLYAGVYDAAGSMSSTSKSRDVRVGSTSVLRLSDLSDDDEWEKSPIMASVGDIGRETIPLNVAISPNDMLLLTLSCPMLGVRTIIHPLPRRDLQKDPFSDETTKDSGLPFALVASIYAHNTSADITHTIRGKSNTADAAAETLYTALGAFDDDSLGKSGTHAWEIVGVAVEISLLRKASTDDERALMRERMDTAQSLCAMAACNSAFEDCQDGAGYDLDAVWQLVSLSRWALAFIADLLKHCLLLSLTSAPEASGSQADGEDLFGSTPVSPSVEATLSPALQTPMLLHLAHPLALKSLSNVLTHIKNLHTFMVSLPAGAEGPRIAKDVLMNIVACSGFDLTALCTFLAGCVEESTSFPVEETRRSLAVCQPTSAIGISLRKTIQKLTSERIIDKPRLLIKPSDIVGTSLEQQTRQKGTDVVSMGLLARHGGFSVNVCARCGGKSEVTNNPDGTFAGARWKTWEKTWKARCVCGGLWAH
ncbi:hypothetical protein FIBSPDRAFT_955383 [Athelia psychrophila]|uniref:Mediator complex subunit 16 C-terminal domain-containing protein n=1 Tax=Athelia psychrophila TaxID=1759441 RepID=A0A166I3H2_9AGAM|nr:hypothetical protein FIBSPDRAFT_955383 [Fibularhizoctonia sp. CBS 109695]